MNLLMGFTCALFLSGISMPLILKVAHRHELYDAIDERKLHNGNIPRLGGVGIFISFLASVILVVLISGEGINTGGRFWVVVVCILSVHLLGLIDDFRNMRARYKFIVELAGSIFLVILGFRFQRIIVPFGSGAIDLGLLSYPISIIWIIGITNALNLIDGMDGLAGGISAIAAGVYGLFFLINANPGGALVCFALCGALIGFLIFNLPPAKIFMGDCGSLFLGFTLAVLPLLGPATGVIEIGLLSTVTILIIPILDTIGAILRRIRAGVSVFSPDKEHIHHKLLDLGFSIRQVLFIVYAAQALLCLIAFSGFFLPLALSFSLKIGSWFIFILLFYGLSLATAKKKTGSYLGRTRSKGVALKSTLLGETLTPRRSRSK
jgi:UDP-GlcNAc:undecaprenyl-phosphate GlcNAc-1-phosphate transferase